jgi:hypothetical protein
MLGGGAKDKEHAMSQISNTAVAVIGIDIGKNSFHVVGHDARGCKSARGPDADLYAKALIHLTAEGSMLDAYSHVRPRPRLQVVKNERTNGIPHG